MAPSLRPCARLLATCLVFCLPRVCRAADAQPAAGQGLTPAQTAEKGVAIQGSFGGVGAALKDGEGCVQISGVTPESPAARAGLLPGSTITAINDVSTERMKAQDAVKLVRGPEGTKVTLVVKGPAGEVRRVELTREKIVLGRPEVSLCAPAIGLMRLTVFNDETAAAVQRALAELQAKGAKALVLDLRGAGGGTAGALQQVAGVFLPGGSALWLFEKQNGERTLVKAPAGPSPVVMPLAVLVDRDTQAAELLAAAIKRNRRGPVIGHRTSGQASPKTMVRNPDGSSRLVPVGTYLLSPGEPISGVGVAPDRELPAGAAPAEFVRAAVEALAPAPPKQP